MTVGKLKPLVVDLIKRAEPWEHSGYYYDGEGEYVVHKKQKWTVITKFKDELFLLRHKDIQSNFTRAAYVLVRVNETNTWEMVAFSEPKSNWRAALIRFKYIADQFFRRQQRTVTREACCQD